MAITTDVLDAFLLQIGPLMAIAYLFSVAIYRLYFHPLAGVPGPKICALTTLYEFWWDCPMVGQFFRRVQEMHDKYGPIVRIGPNEVHIRDPSYYEVLYSNNQKIEREPKFYDWNFGSVSTFHTMPSDLYRLRRSALSKSFSPAAMDRLEPLMLEKVKKLFVHLDKARKSGEVVDLAIAFRALAMDIISAHAVPNPRDYLDQPDLGHSMLRSHTSETTIFNWSRHTPWLVPLLRRLPEPICPVWDKAALGSDQFQNHFHRLTVEAENVMNTTKEHDDPSITVLEAVRTSPLLPEHERSYKRILSEAGTILGAGVDGPSNNLAGFVLFVLLDPPILHKLRAELKLLHTPSAGRKDSIHETSSSIPSNTTAATPPAPSPSSPSYTLPDLVPFRTLDKLEYLQACIRETLRFYPAVLSRLPRVNPSAPMSYTTPASTTTTTPSKTYTFPPGTTISMNVTDGHADPSVFPDPTRFRPERWLETDGDPERRARMDKAFVPFSRGARMCIGHELARRELTLVLGNLFRIFELEVADGTSLDDLANARDFFGPLPERGRGRVGVRVKGLYLKEGD